MNENELIRRWPRLFHVAAPGAWDTIGTYGLLSTSAALDLHGVTGARREAIEARPRARSVQLTSPGLPDILVRDQKPLLPLRDAHLDDGLTVADWCRILNRRVYLFTDRADAERLLAAYPGQRMLVIDTGRLIERHRDAIRLAGINTGYAMRRPARRGLQTFRPISDFTGQPKEFTVEQAIPDIVEIGRP